jgi:predicted glycosyltransferase
MSAPGRQPRALFYAGDGFGLGHVSICLALMQEVARLRPDALLLLVTGSRQAHALELPPSAEYVKLPALVADDRYAALPADAAAETPLRGAHVIREALLTQTLLTFRPDVVHVDWSPAGEGGELRRPLLALRAACPTATLVAGLPDMTDPAELRAAWAAHGADDLLDTLYDRLVVYGDSALYDPSDAYGLSQAARAKLSFSGYIARAAPPDDRAATRAALGAGPDDELLVATVGGGADGAALLEACLGALREPELAGVVAQVITGPLLERAARERLARLAAGLPRVTLTPFTSRFSATLAAADAVLAMGGYNTSVGLVALRQRALLVPRVGLGAEQLLRAQRFAARGLVRLLHPDAATPARLARNLRATLAGPAPTADLDLEGAARLGALLAGALPPPTA